MRFLPVVLAAIIAAGCRCPSTGGPERTEGEIGLVYEVGAESRTGREAVYDFGSVFMEHSRSRKIVIRNLGRGAITLSGLERVGGVHAEIGGQSTGEDPLFFIPFESGTVLRAAEVLELDVTYRPRTEVVPAVDHTLELLLRAENTREGEGTASITLKGRAITGNCAVPEVLDFGNVVLDDRATLSFTLRNPTDAPIEAFISELRSDWGDDAAFAFAPRSARGTVPLDPDQTRDVVIEFSPTAQKRYTANLTARVSADCPESTLELVGSGVDAVLAWSPTELDCGYVTPGFEVTRQITFRNSRASAIELSGFRFETSGEFEVVDPDGAALPSLTVPGAEKDGSGEWQPGTSSLAVVCRPQQLGPRGTVLQFDTTVPGQPGGAIPLRAFGGGPDIQVTPAPTLNFGQVPYFEGAGSSQTRRLTVMNVGTRPAIPDVNAHLHLTGATITDLEGNPSQDFALVQFPPPGYPSEGLEPVAGKNVLQLEVRVNPTSTGLKQARLLLSSNDPDEPEVEILLSADVVVVPPCQYTVTPAQLSFGLIQPPKYRDLSFTITNLGTQPGEICLLSALELAPGSNPFFVLPEGAIESATLQPGEQKEVAVRVQPQGPSPAGVTPIQGEVQFYMSSPDRPRAQVQLDAQLAASCLTVAPDELEFGTARVGCSSAIRTFSVYNSCQNPVILQQFGFADAAGQPAGGPDCPGTAACPEFVAVQTPSIPAGGLELTYGSAPVRFQIKYRPIDLGADSGHIALTALQDGATVTYVVPLRGRGDTTGTHTDVIIQEAEPRADILLTIDNSCSMGGFQQDLAANFANFIRYATVAKVDYRIAVTTTDNDPGGEQGRFVHGATHPEKVLDPNTANLESKFAAKVNVGTLGSGTEMCFAPSLQALTAPLINWDNAGFLRQEAALAVVCIMDEEEQSPQSSTYYLDAFLNIKGHHRKGLFTFNAIASLSHACLSLPEDGTLAQMVASTNGVIEDICNPSWATALEDLGKKAMGYRTKFYLTSAADLTQGPIEVVIDGTPIPSTDPTGAPYWTWDPVDNSVNFEPMHVPEPGSTMTITYPTACYQ